MPNYDGTGPLKRGRIIGRGLGPCRQGIDAFPRLDTDTKMQADKEEPAK